MNTEIARPMPPANPSTAFDSSEDAINASVDAELAELANGGGGRSKAKGAWSPDQDAVSPAISPAIQSAYCMRLSPPAINDRVPPDFFKAREARDFLSGALAGVMTKAVLAPLETIRYWRTRMIVGVGSRSIPGL